LDSETAYIIRMHGITEVFGIAAAVALVSFAFYWNVSRSRTLLQGWAAKSGFEILQSEFRFVRRGPFFWTSSKGQTVYYVRVQDGQGQVRSGWVRCGGWWLGLWSDRTEVRWDANS
jgi:hypothetical protein